MNATWPTAMTAVERPKPNPASDWIKKPGRCQHDREAEDRLAAGGHRVLCHESSGGSSFWLEPLGFAEQDILALELIDRPAAGRSRRRRSSGAERVRSSATRWRSRRGSGGAEEERNSGDRHQAVKQVQLDARRSVRKMSGRQTR